MLKHLLGIILLAGGVFLLAYPGIPENIHILKYILGSILVLIAIFNFTYTCAQLHPKVIQIHTTH